MVMLDDFYRPTSMLCLCVLCFPKMIHNNAAMRRLFFFPPWILMRSPLYWLIELCWLRCIRLDNTTHLLYSHEYSESIYSILFLFIVFTTSFARNQAWCNISPTLCVYPTYCRKDARLFAPSRFLFAMSCLHTVVWRGGTEVLFRLVLEAFPSQGTHVQGKVDHGEPWRDRHRASMFEGLRNRVLAYEPQQAELNGMLHSAHQTTSYRFMFLTSFNFYCIFCWWLRYLYDWYTLLACAMMDRAQAIEGIRCGLATWRILRKAVAANPREEPFNGLRTNLEPVSLVFETKEPALGSYRVILFFTRIQTPILVRVSFTLHFR